MCEVVNHLIYSDKKQTENVFITCMSFWAFALYFRTGRDTHKAMHPGVFIYALKLLPWEGTGSVWRFIMQSNRKSKNPGHKTGEECRWVGRPQGGWRLAGRGANSRNLNPGIYTLIVFSLSKSGGDRYVLGRDTFRGGPPAYTCLGYADALLLHCLQQTMVGPVRALWTHRVGVILGRTQTSRFACFLLCVKHN